MNIWHEVRAGLPDVKEMREAGKGDSRMNTGRAGLAANRGRLLSWWVLSEEAS